MQVANFISGLPGADGVYPDNWYYEPQQDDGRPGLVGRPGHKEVCKPHANREVRGVYCKGNTLFAVLGNTLYKIDTGWNVTTLGTLGTSTGKCWIQDNGLYLWVCDGQGLYSHELGSSSLSGVSANAGTLVEVDGYFVWNQPGSGYFAIATTPTIDTTDKANAEARSDNLTGIERVVRKLALVGEKTTEWWFNEGAGPDFPFSRVSGSFSDYGSLAPGSIVAADNSVFMLNQHWQFMRSNGYNWEKISEPQIDILVSKFERTSDCTAFVYYDGPHAFVIWNFPTANRTLCYDIFTQLWHTRSSGTEGGRWRANCYEKFNDMHIIGDYQNGCLYQMKATHHTEDGDLIRMLRRSMLIYDQENRSNQTFPGFEAEFKAGMGRIQSQGQTALASGASQGAASIEVDSADNIKEGYDVGITLDDGTVQWVKAATPPVSTTVYLSDTLDDDAAADNTVYYQDARGEDPQAMLRWSDDGGNSWSNELWESIGKQGEYTKRAKWDKCGSSHGRIVELVMTDPVERVLKALYMPKYKLGRPGS